MQFLADPLYIFGTVLCVNMLIFFIDINPLKMRSFTTGLQLLYPLGYFWLDQTRNIFEEREAAASRRNSNGIFGRFSQGMAQRTYSISCAR
jgi:hypothetical protein